MSNIAAVTGGTGMIGRRIAARLAASGWRVRILTRQPAVSAAGIEVVSGSLTDRAALERLVARANAVFHCAAELKDPRRMEEVNVGGTSQLIDAASRAEVSYFCHLSSVGVIGRVRGRVATESTPCRPQNQYEQTKLAAEALVGEGMTGARVTILRPTNVVAEENIGVLRGLCDDTAGGRLRRLLIAGECAHMVHADDVADAALHRIGASVQGVERFIVSTDHESGGTFGALWSLVHSLEGRGDRPIPAHVPLRVPWAIRRILGRSRNRGDLAYSSDALRATGFTYRLGIKGGLEQLSASGAFRV